MVSRKYLNSRATSIMAVEIANKRNVVEIMECVNNLPGNYCEDGVLIVIRSLKRLDANNLHEIAVLNYL